MKLINISKSSLTNGRKLFYCFLFISALQLFTQISAVAATVTVTNTNNSGAGSLRQAILDANATTADDTIAFNLSGCPNGVCTITLTSGELAITGKLTITNSTGAGNLLISGNNASRVFYLRSFADAAMNGITITGGNGTGTTVAGIDGFGGGITSESSTSKLTLNNSIVSNNSASQSGGGVIIHNGTITNSTISSNSAGLGGGGIINGFGTVTVLNSTISGNTANFNAGGISNRATLNLINATVTNNRSNNVSCAGCGGGGIGNMSSGTVNMLNTVVAGNTDPNAASSPDFFGTVSSTSSFNLIGNNKGMTGIANGTNNNQVGTNTNPIDARLASLGNYGGSTQTHALLSNSPAINTGSDCVINLTCPSNNPPAALTTDQRGAGFPRKVGSAIDIGAVESAAQNVVFNNGQILFQSSRDGNSEIYKMNPDGSNQQRLTNSPEGESNGKWSPDNRKILYNKSINSTTNQIWVMNADGSNQSMISDATGNNVSNGWSPDGQKILFTKGQTNSGERIWTMNADGSNKVQLTNTNMIDHFPVWSPDSSKIAFGRCDTNFVCDIFTMSADGSNQTNLTPDNPNDDDIPKWTPDGSKIVFGRQTTPEDENTFGDFNTFVMNADGTNKQSLTNDPIQTYSPAAISPDGNSVAMDVRPNRIQLDIATVGINGNNLTNLTNNSANDFFGVWSPDNTKIAFYRGTTSASIEIYVMNADGSSVVRLTNNSASDFVTDWQVVSSYTTPTPAGQNITVSPTDNTNLTFSNVTTGGNTTVTVLSPEQVPSVPSGFSIFASNLVFNITTSAVFSGSITVTFQIPNVADAAACANLRSLHYENGAWTTNTNAAPTYGAGTQTCTVSQTVSSLSPFAVARINGTTAAAVNIGGRVSTSNGRGIRGAMITLTDSNGVVRTAVTNSFGYYRFDDVRAGGTYIITARAKRFTFGEPSQILNVNEDTNDINFTGHSSDF